MEILMETHAEIQTDALFIAWSENRRTNKTPQPLQEWIRQYPEATSDLTQWVAESPVAERAEYRVASALEEARAIEIGRNVIAEMRARYQTAAPVALASLYETARSQGVNPKSLATQLGIGL